MTALGKILVIFVFLFTVAWMILTVVVWQTGQDWHARADNYRKIAEDNYKGAVSIKQQAEATTDDARSEIAAKAAENERLKKDLENANAIYKNAVDAYEKKLAADRKSDATITGLQAKIKSEQDQAALIDQQLKESNVALDATTRKAKDAEAKMEDAILEAKSFKQQSDRLTTRLQETNDRLQELVQSGGKSSMQGAPPAPENFRGTVRAYKDGFVEITPGLNAGLRAGTILKIQRLDGGGKYVGTLTIGSDLNPDRAIGTWRKPANIKNPVGDDLPKVGDEVVPNK